MMNQFYRETLINSSAELFKAVDEKSRIEGLSDFTEEEEKLASALNYWAEWDCIQWMILSICLERKSWKRPKHRQGNSAKTLWLDSVA